MNSPRLRIALVLAVGLVALTTTLLLLGLLGKERFAQAAASPRYAYGPGDVLCVTPGGGPYPGCTQVFTNVQAAVDFATGGETIKVATGVYTSINTTVYKTVTIRGGYTTTFADPPDPVANPTTLDAQGQGTVLVIGMNVSPTIEGLHITGGNGFSGGGVSMDIAAKPVISGCQIYSNTALSGGGIYVSNEAAPTLNNNLVFSNTASYGGGVYVVTATATLSNNLVFSNTATSGGGLYLNSSAVTLNRNIVMSNTASGSGGGGYLRESAVTLNDNTIVSNDGGNAGGGLTFSDSSATLSGDIVMFNKAKQGGGLSSNGAAIILVNTVIADNLVNYSSGYGSAINSWASSYRLLHATIARNTGGNGSGVYVRDWAGTYSTIAMTNTILVSHTVGITATAGNTVTLNGILWYSNATNYGGLGVFSVTNAITDDPALAADGYHLTAGSAARGKGVNAGVTTDIDGEPRHDPPDLGADEYYPQTGLAVSKEAAPSLVQAGSQLTYTLHITNTTNVDLHATITDTLPTHITLGQTSGGTLILPGGTITWTPVITALGGTWTETIVVTVAMGYAGILTNTVQAATLEGASGIYTATSQVQVIPALAVTKDAAPNPVRAGSQLTYTLRVTNTGNMDLHATITDTLPDHITPVGVITWTATIPAPGGVWVRTVVVTVTRGYSGTLINQVQVTSEEGATGEAQVTVSAIGGYRVYLPIVLRN